MKLLIRNLARTTTEEDIKKLFETHGKVQYCKLVLDQKTGKSKGFAFIEMPSPGHAKAAVKKLNGKSVDGNTLRVKKATTNSPPSETVNPNLQVNKSPDNPENKITAEEGPDSVIKEESPQVMAHNKNQSKPKEHSDKPSETDAPLKPVNQGIWSSDD